MMEKQLFELGDTVLFQEMEQTVQEYSICQMDTDGDGIYGLSNEERDTFAYGHELILIKKEDEITENEV